MIAIIDLNSRAMIDALIKPVFGWILMMAGIVGSTISSENVLYYIGCATSIVLGFMLRLAQIRKKQPLTRSLVLWLIPVTLGICWLGWIIWSAGAHRFGIPLTGYLFGFSFFAVIISETLDKVGGLSIPKIFTVLAEKWLSFTSSKDKEEND